jgi:hypothetical protein
MKNSTTKMHRIVLGLAGLMSVFAITVPISMTRVSSTVKFAGQPFNSQTCETYNSKQRRVVDWMEDCSQMSVTDSTPNTASAMPSSKG